MSRRAVLVGAGLGAVGIGAAGAGIAAILRHRSAAQSGPATLSSLEESTTAKINHLLRRAGFGPSPADIGHYISLGFPGAVDYLLDYEHITDDLDAKLAALKLDPSKLDDLMREWVLRMIYSKRQLEEKMTLFWHGVLVSSYRDVGGQMNYYYMRDQNQLLRQHATSRFDDLMNAITGDPAMLRYLNGVGSSGNNPNENYARELMELFTLGIKDATGNDNYTQDDVHQGALALTGWTIDKATGKAQVDPKRHYSGSVNFLGHTGTLGTADVIRIVCGHPSTGRHLAFRLWSFFVAENPTEEQLKPVADAYYTSNHSIAAMLRALFTSSSFTDEAAYRARVKSPVEFCIGAIRALGLETDGKGIAPLMAQMGQTLYDPPNVSGWDGDKLSAGWLNTTTWMERVNFINTLVVAAGGQGQKGNVTSTKSALQALMEQYKLKGADDFTAYFVASLLDNQLPSDRAQPARDALRSANDPHSLTLSEGGTIPLAGARHALYLLMAMPEYQMN